MTVKRPPTAIAAGLALLAACGGDGPSAPRVPSAITVVAGAGQTGPVRGTLPAPLQVRVTDGSGPLGGVVVAFAASGRGSVVPAVDTTDPDGLASASWILDSVAGPQTASATVQGVAPATFTATATPAQPILVVPTSQDLITAVVGRQVPVPPSVRVTDLYGNPTPGVAVTFSVVQGGGTVTGAGATTNAQGIATVGSWTLGPAAGLNRLRAALSDAIFNEVLALGTPAAIRLVDGNNQVANAGTSTAIRPVVQALDGDGQPLQGAQVTFEVIGGGGRVTGPVQTTGIDGLARVGNWILGTAPGENRLEARVAGLPGVVFTATGRAAVASAVTPTTPLAISGLQGNFPAFTPAVRVTDAAGNPVAGITVRFEVAAGDPTLYVPTTQSDFDGRAALAAWRLGAATTQSVRAVSGAAPPVVFTATADPVPPPAFNVEVRYPGTPPTPAQKAAFDAAVVRWQSIIMGDLEDAVVNVSASSCAPAMNETIDDLVIFAELVPIDGPGNVLGSAGPCLIRVGSRLTAVGRMRFDTADLATLETNGRLNDVILHEMGHVLGIGSLWGTFGLVTGAGGTDPFFTGGAARGAFVGAFQPGTFYSGNMVPVENTGGGGTRDVHWRETTVTNELMTGFLNSGVANPLSAITIASLRDLGYVANDLMADPFSFAAALVGATTPAFALREEPLPGPIWLLDRRGRLAGSIPR